MKKRFSTFYRANKPFCTLKTSVSKTHKIGIFPKGLVHGFGQKFEILLTFRFMQNTPRKSIWWRSRYKTSLSRQYKHGFKKKAKLAFLSMILVKKLKFFHVLCLSKIDREKVFADVLDKKEAFQDYKNICLWKTQNKNFFHSGWSILLVQNFRFLQLLFLCKIDQERVLGTFC